MELLVHNEFAAVAVTLDTSAHGPRLRLEDKRAGRVAYLDPLELEGLVWAPARLLAALVDPATRWNDTEEEETQNGNHPKPVPARADRLAGG